MGSAGLTMKAYSLVLVVVLGLSSCLRVDSQTSKASWRDIFSAAHGAIIGPPLKFFRFFFPKPIRHYPWLANEYYVYKYKGKDNVEYANTRDARGKQTSYIPPPNNDLAFNEGRLQSREEVDKLLRVIRIHYFTTPEGTKNEERRNALFTPAALKDQKNGNLEHTYKLDHRWMVQVDFQNKKTREMETHVQLFSFIAPGATVTVVCGKKKVTVKRGFLWGLLPHLYRAVRRQKPVLPFVIDEVRGGTCGIGVYALDSHNFQLSGDKEERLSQLKFESRQQENLLSEMLK